MEGDAAVNVRKNVDGQWVLSVPLPLYGLIWKQCHCRKWFWTTKRYERHYLRTHANEVRG